MSEEGKILDIVISVITGIVVYVVVIFIAIFVFHKIGPVIQIPTIIVAILLGWGMYNSLRNSKHRHGN